MQDNRYIVNSLSVETNHLGVSELLRFYIEANKLSYSTITLDLTECIHIDANLSALILAISHKLQLKNKVRVFVEFNKSQNIFFRNGLVSHLQGKGNNNQYGDSRESTIPLKIFNPDEDESFCSYLSNDFFSHRSLINVPLATKQSLRSHYLEIFNNVWLHANTSLPIFSCGQFFPEKNILKFTLIDIGDGFLKKINVNTNGRIDNDKSAIIWATEGLNTTKDVSTFGPGGTGLKLLKKYCLENNGSLHISSGSGYVNMLNGRTLEYNLPCIFQGSIINIIMRNI